jgi:hypothetical protein
LNTLLDWGVFDAVPFEGSVSIENLAATVKLDAGILSADTL